MHFSKTSRLGAANLFAFSLIGLIGAAPFAAAADPVPYSSLPAQVPQSAPSAPASEATSLPAPAPPSPPGSPPASLKDAAESQRLAPAPDGPPPPTVAEAPPSPAGRPPLSTVPVSSSPTPPSAEVAQSGVAPPSFMGSESATLRSAIDAALSGDLNRAFQLKAALVQPISRRLVDYAAVDSAGTMMSFEALKDASRDLAGWPHAGRRRAALEKALEPASAPPSQVIAFFPNADPATAQGAIALAGAYEAQNRRPEAEALIRRFWRTKVFEADQQARIRARFGPYILPDDDAVRLEMLLYGTQGPAVRAMMDVVTPDVRALAEARIALRGDRNDAPALVDLVAPALKTDPGLSFDRAHYLRKRDLDVLALALAPQLPSGPAPTPEIGALIWTERRALMTAALKIGDAGAAYSIVANHGFGPGSDYADAEFFAGWLALTRKHDPQLADTHFARLEAVVASPISLARANFWRGRAASAMQDKAKAGDFYAKAAQYYTTFYGQLAAEKIGRRELLLGADPLPGPSDRAAFEADPLAQAVRLLHDAGEKDLMRTFALADAETSERQENLVLLVDLLRSWGEPDLAMRAARNAAQRGYVLPERAYPLLPMPSELREAEPAFVLSIARQESNFDPTARSGPGALGLMQLMPATAQVMARKIGVAFSTGMLREPNYNLRLGGTYLGHLIEVFGGSYLLASAGYNAGPGRPSAWTGYCGDPRGSSTDPVDFIECIPFSETRNYVMRTLETTEVYRARLNGGHAPLTLAADLRRGGWTGDTAPAPILAAPTTGPVPYTSLTAPALGK